MLAAATVAVLLAVAGGGLWLGSAVIGRHRAQGAADLAAAAAAAALPAGAAEACGRAAQLVSRMRADPVDCRVVGLDVVVTVDVPVVFGGWGAGSARAAARAGPE